jgi:hypothetical protein
MHTKVDRQKGKKNYQTATLDGRSREWKITKV